jgi:predicted AlkP superfamily pyrophosphatase or phosphodiesterase
VADALSGLLQAVNRQSRTTALTVKRRWIVLSVVGMCAAVLLSTPAAQPPTALKLIVLIMVDQMRADYVDRFQADWTGGLKRLVTGGAWFRNAAYPYLNTVTCVGHATVATGTFPKTHGVIQNTWWDRDTQSLRPCTTDEKAKAISYGGAVSGSGDSAWRLRAPTLADRLRTERGAQVVTMSLKARSAIMMAGRGGQAVTWLAESGDRWMTSSAFSSGRVPAVRTFLNAHPIAADYGKTWTRLLPPARYKTPDDVAEEEPPVGWTRRFPHVLTGMNNGPDLSFYDQWQRSPYGNDYLARLALALVQSMGLGKGSATDVLAISFSSTDLVGHAFGPESQEVQDIYAQLDRTLGTFLDQLNTLVGEDQYVVALSADHGVTSMPEERLRSGKDAGRLNSGAVAGFIDAQVQGELGAGRYVLGVNGNDVYFEPGGYARLAANPQAMANVIARVKKVQGIAELYPEERLRTETGSTDSAFRAAALSFFPGRSGDMVLALTPGWMTVATGATHGSMGVDDQKVPIIFFGRGIRQGVFDEAVTPADIAPTLAALAGFTMSSVDGQVLKGALR